MEQKGKSVKSTQDSELSRAADIRHGINLAYSYLLLALADTNDRSREDKKPYLSKPQFAEFYQKLVKNLQERINGSIEGEPGIDTYDIAYLHFAHVRDIHEYYGLPLREDEVL